MASVLSSLNDKFDSTDARYSQLIYGLSDAANTIYANATQNLKVGLPHMEWLVCQV